MPEKDDRFGPVIKTATVNYRRDVRFPDTIKVRVRATEIERSSVNLEHEVVSHESYEIVTDGTTIVALVVFRKNRSKRLDKRARDRITGLDIGVRERAH